MHKIGLTHIRRALIYSYSKICSSARFGKFQKDVAHLCHALLKFFQGWSGTSNCDGVVSLCETIYKFIHIALPFCLLVGGASIVGDACDPASFFFSRDVLSFIGYLLVFLLSLLIGVSQIFGYHKMELVLAKLLPFRRNGVKNHPFLRNYRACDNREIIPKIDNLLIGEFQLLGLAFFRPAAKSPEIFDMISFAVFSHSDLLSCIIPESI